MKPLCFTLLFVGLLLSSCATQGPSDSGSPGGIYDSRTRLEIQEDVMQMHRQNLQSTSGAY